METATLAASALITRQIARRRHRRAPDLQQRQPSNLASVWCVIFSTSSRFFGLITVARVSLCSDKRRLLYSDRVIFLLSFSNHRFFDVPGTIFAKLPHDAMCPEIFYLLQATCPLKIWRAKTPNFRRFADPKSTLWAPPYSVMQAKSGNLKQ